MPGRRIVGLSCVSVLVLSGGTQGGTLKDDLTALGGSWVSKAVKDADGRGSGIIKLQFSGAKDALGGRGSLEVKTKRSGSTSSSTRIFTFKLVQQGGNRAIVAPGSSGKGLSLTYRLEGDKLILTGEIASPRVSYNLQNVALRRATTK